MRTALACFLALAPVAGCDVALFPEIAEYQESVTARATVNVDAAAMPGDGVQEVEIEIGEVLLHRPADDGWVVIGAQTAAVLLDGLEQRCAFEDVPVAFESYDNMRIVVEAVRVKTDVGWQDVEIVEPDTETEATIDIGDHVTFDLAFDLEASLAHEAEGWTFVPVVDVTGRLGAH